MRVVNPATEEAEEIQETPIEHIPDMVKKAQIAQKNWGQMPLQERVSLVKAIVQQLQEKKDQFAAVITQDMGKPRVSAEREIDTTVWHAMATCDKATEWLAPEPLENGETVFDPLGVVAVISPWNFPVFVPELQVIPALLTGNAVVFKPSEYSLRSGKLFGELFENALPQHVLQTVIGGKEHGKALVKTDVEMVAFTGSSRAGKDIMRNSADRLHTIQLELGGLGAAIVLEDVDVQNVARLLVQRNCGNSGQICDTVKRVYVQQSIADAFIQAAVEESKKITVGNPLENNYMGPLVADFQLEKVESIIADAKEKGATIHTGGERIGEKGYYYPSTIVTNTTDDMRILTEEPFGPLLPIVPIDSWEDAVKKANGTRYGLIGSVWTKDVEKGKRIARQLEVGVAGVNAHGPGPFGSPFGGAKESGIGRGNSKEGLREFTNVKYVQVGGHLDY